jgi:hypothetical protein
MATSQLEMKYFSRLQNTFSANFDDSFHLEILKEALLRAIHDIDAKFSEVSLTFCSLLQNSYMIHFCMCSCIDIFQLNYEGSL